MFTTLVSKISSLTLKIAQNKD